MKNKIAFLAFAGLSLCSCGGVTPFASSSAAPSAEAYEGASSLRAAATEYLDAAASFRWRHIQDISGAYSSGQTPQYTHWAFEYTVDLSDPEDPYVLMKTGREDDLSDCSAYGLLYQGAYYDSDGRSARRFDDASSVETILSLAKAVRTYIDLPANLIAGGGNASSSITEARFADEGDSYLIEETAHVEYASQDGSLTFIDVDPYSATFSKEGHFTHCRCERIQDPTPHGYALTHIKDEISVFYGETITKLTPSDIGYTE